MKTLIQENKEFYKHLMVVDNTTPKNSGKIAMAMRTAFLHVDNPKNNNRMLYKSCVRHAIKIDGIWGYECFHLDRKKQILYRYAMNIFTKRPYPDYFKGHNTEIFKEGSDAEKIYNEYKKDINFQEVTFCNLNTAIYVQCFTDKKLANFFVNGIPKIRELLQNGKIFSDNYIFHKVTPEEAVDFSEHGGLAIAISGDDTKPQNEHVAPIYGQDVAINKKDEPFGNIDDQCPWLLNVGADNRYGYQSIYFGFYINKLEQLEYYILLKLFKNEK